MRSVGIGNGVEFQGNFATCKIEELTRAVYKAKAHLEWLTAADHLVEDDPEGVHVRGLASTPVQPLWCHINEGSASLLLLLVRVRGCEEARKAKITDCSGKSPPVGFDGLEQNIGRFKVTVDLQKGKKEKINRGDQIRGVETENREFRSDKR